MTADRDTETAPERANETAPKPRPAPTEAK